MKIAASSLLAALLAGSSVSAFQPASTPSSVFRSSGSALSAVKPQRDGDHRPNPTFSFAAAASGLAAWTLASHVAFASMLAVTSVDVPVFSEQSYSSVVVAVETMDFSMPSYSDALGGSTKSIKSSEGAPAFNPFGDFKPDFKNKEEALPSSPAPSPAPVEMPKMPEFKAPEFKTPEFKAPDVKVPEFKAPDFEMPEFKAPDIKMPEFKAPDIKVPEFKAPDIKVPEFSSSSFSMPKFDMPKMDVPKFDMPKMDMPKFDVPKMDMPKFDIPSSSGGYDLDLPKVPKMDMPKIDMPKINMPKLPAFSNPFAGRGGSDSSGSGDFLDPREVRDEKARQARQVYLDADNDAKVIEQQARDIRAVANEKKKLAAEAKDLACADRLGGKWICLRNPFNAGF